MRDVEVYSSSSDYCHTLPITGYAKGVEHDIIKKQLLNKKPL